MGTQTQSNTVRLLHRTMNLKATPLGLYDLPTPTAPRHVQVRYAIHEHREERRHPLDMAHLRG